MGFAPFVLKRARHSLPLRVCQLRAVIANPSCPATSHSPLRPNAPVGHEVAVCERHSPSEAQPLPRVRSTFRVGEATGAMCAIDISCRKTTPPTRAIGISCRGGNRRHVFDRHFVSGEQPLQPVGSTFRVGGTRAATCAFDLRRRRHEFLDAEREVPRLRSERLRRGRCILHV